MEPRRKAVMLAWTSLLAASLLVSGCHKKDLVPAPEPSPSASVSPSPGASGSGSPSPSPAPSATLPSLTATTSVNLSATGGTITLGSGGLSGTLTYPSNTGGTAAAAFTITTQPLSIPSPAPTDTPIVFFEFQLSASVQFTSPFSLSSCAFPTSFGTSGLAFTQTVYDQTTGALLGTPMSGTVSGQTVTFGPVNGSAFNATAGDVYLIVISYSGSSGGGSGGGSKI